MKVGVKNILMRTKSKECIILIEGLVSKMLVIKKGGKSGLGKNDTYGQSGSIKQTHRHDTCYSSYMQKMCRLAGKHLGNNRNVALLKKFIT